MASVKRYDMRYTWSGTDMWSCESGDYVLASDYERLETVVVDLWKAMVNEIHAFALYDSNCHTKEEHERMLANARDVRDKHGDLALALIGEGGEEGK